MNSNSIALSLINLEEPIKKQIVSQAQSAHFDETLFSVPYGNATHFWKKDCIIPTFSIWKLITQDLKYYIRHEAIVPDRKLYMWWVSTWFHWYDSFSNLNIC